MTELSERNIIRLYEADPSLYSTTKEFDVGNGWFPVLVSMTDKLTGHLLPSGLPPKITRITQKQGLLKVYAAEVDHYVESVFKEAATESAYICETCGEEGRLRRIAGHLEVRCEEHKLP